METKPTSELTPEQAARRRTLKAFAWFGLASLAPFGLWKWLNTQPRDQKIPWFLRQVLNQNAEIAQAAFSHKRLIPTFSKDKAARQVRINGKIGLKKPIDPDQWRLQIQHPGKAPLSLTLDEIKKLPKHEIVFEFKCIEGWSQIQHWGGVRLSDFLQAYQLGVRTGSSTNPPTEDDWYHYMGLQTPDGGYYVGIDMASALHPQTMLCYEMNGKPLEDLHGAPLRLIIPVKYGVKNLKRIGLMTFSDQRPRDYWAEQGYDYYIGL